MKRIWTVIVRSGTEYHYKVEAESNQEAIEKVKQGDVLSDRSKEAPVTYEAH